MNWQYLAAALMLAGPVVAFPFSRGYYVFYVFILIVGLVRVGLPTLWKEAQGMRLAIYGLVLPVVFATIGLGLLQGHIERAWLEKLGVMSLAALLGLTTAGISRRPDGQPLASWLLMGAILSWALDGLWQLATGYSVSGQEMLGRLTSYFSHPYKFGFFISFFSLLPVFFLYQRRSYQGSWLAFTCLLLSGLVVVSAGSRFGMLAWLLGAALFVLLCIRHWPRRYRFGALAGLPLVMMVLLSGLYTANDAFAVRMQQSLQIVESSDYQTINQASSGRLDIWYPAAAMLQDHWLLGVGPSKISEVIKPYLAPDNVYRVKDIKIFHAHQVVLGVWLAAGLLGIVGFLAFYGWVCVWLWRERDRAGLGWACVLVWVLAWLPLGTHLDFYASEMLLWSFYMLGLGFGLQQLAHSQPDIYQPKEEPAAA